MSLTVKRVAKLIRRGEPGRHLDDGAMPAVRGLYLVVAHERAAHWELRYQINGRARQMGLGSAHTLTLDQARARAREARALLIAKIDPLEKRRSERAALRAANARAVTFAEATRLFLKQHEPKWRSRIHARQFAKSLTDYVLPTIGQVNVADIDTAMVLKALEPHWLTKTETMSRVRGRIEAVLGWATVRGFRSGDNPARWRNHLDKVLPSKNEIAPAEHFAALPFAAVPVLMATLSARQDVAAQALRFTILTAARSGEVLGATWDEINFDTATWTVPAARMKANRAHEVPLSPAAVELLRSLYPEDGNPFVFIGARGAGLAAAALTKLLRRMGYTATTHGFRSAFSTWAAERTAFPREIAEASLAHVVGSAVERAYRRTTSFDRRRKLVETWARFCTAPARAEGADVVAMRR